MSTWKCPVCQGEAVLIAVVKDGVSSRLVCQDQNCGTRFTFQRVYTPQSDGGSCMDVTTVREGSMPTRLIDISPGRNVFGEALDAALRKEYHERARRILDGEDTDHVLLVIPSECVAQVVEVVSPIVKEAAKHA